MKTLSKIEHEDSIEALERERAQLMNVWASEDGRAERVSVGGLSPETATNENTLVIALPETPPASFYRDALIRSKTWDKLSESEQEKFRHSQTIEDFGKEMSKELPSKQHTLDYWAEFYGLHKGLPASELRLKIMQGFKMSAKAAKASSGLLQALKDIRSLHKDLDTPFVVGNYSSPYRPLKVPVDETGAAYITENEAWAPPEVPPGVIYQWGVSFIDGNIKMKKVRFK